MCLCFLILLLYLDVAVLCFVDDVQYELLSTVMEYAGLVDANALLFLWPEELVKYRLCIISGDQQNPIFSSFCSARVCEGTRQDVIMRCKGSHFTLLQPHGGDSRLGGEMVSEFFDYDH